MLEVASATQMGFEQPSHRQHSSILGKKTYSQTIKSHKRNENLSQVHQDKDSDC
jgi:hypothetical protein